MTSVLMSRLAMLGGAVRSRAALHLEILALSHQLQGLQRAEQELCSNAALLMPVPLPRLRAP
jgi:hypothetical protein